MLLAYHKIIAFMIGLLLMCALQGRVEASNAGQPGQTATSASTAVTIPTSTDTANIQSAIRNYRSNRCDLTWAPVASAFKSFLSANSLVSSEALRQSNLSDLGLMSIEQPMLRLWYFPDVAESHGVYLQWTESARAPKAKSRERSKGAGGTGTSVHVQYLDLPNTVRFKDARVLSSTDQSAAQRPPAGGNTGKIKKRPQKSKPALAPSKLLILAGVDDKHGNLWLAAYKFSAGLWCENATPLTKIPPFLLSSLTGNISFSGNDLIITASPSSDNAMATPSRTNSSIRGKAPDFSVYKLSLRLVGGYFVLDGQGKVDSAYGIITDFLQAELKGRTDLAKAWLEDPSVASIPRYVQLFNRGSMPNFRLISLSAPPSVCRYRLVTFEKDDLIFDVARLKGQWVIRAIFVAPSDTGWQKITRDLPPLSSCNL